MKKIKALFSCVLALTTVFSLTACGGGTQSTSASASSGNTWLNNAGLNKSETSAQLYEMAKKEGKVVVYSMSSRITDVKTSFEKQYPGVTLEAYDMRMPDISDKVKREYQAGVHNADLIFIKDGDGTLYNEYIKTGMLYNYAPKDIAAKIQNKSFIEPEFSEYFELQQVFYNTEANKTCPIHNWWDLTKPEYKGKIMVKNPTADPEIRGVFDAFIQHGDDMAKAYKEDFGSAIKLNGTENAGYEFIKRLASNDLVYTTSGDDVLKGVGASGQKNPPIGISTSSKMGEWINKGMKIGVASGLSPKDGVISPAMTLIAANSTHVNAAKLLVRFMAGDSDGKADGLKPFTIQGAWPTRSDVAPVNTPAISTMKLWDLNLSFNYKNKSKLDNFWLSIQK